MVRNGEFCEFERTMCDLLLIVMLDEKRIDDVSLGLPGVVALVPAVPLDEEEAFAAHLLVTQYALGLEYVTLADGVACHRSNNSDDNIFIYKYTQQIRFASRGKFH